MMTAHGPIANFLLESVDLVPAASFGSLVNGTGVDMRNWDGVAALVNVQTVAGAGTWQVYLQMADDAAFTQNVTTIVDASTGAACQTPAAQTTTGLWWIEAYRPPRRFVRSVSNPLVANITLGVVMLRYKHTGLLPVNARDSLGLTNRISVRAS
jgi:hypothetical protein